MTQTAKFINDLTTAHDYERAMSTFNRIKEGIPGWSHFGHYLFFRSLLATTQIENILICGVYHGLDLKLISHLLWNEHRGRNVRLTGVDLFSDKPCADWPLEAKGKTWEEAGMGPSPNMEAAQKNAPLAHLHKSHSIEFMISQQGSPYDFIYLDTAHDYETVKQEIIASVNCRTPDCILAGDDYTGPGNWGVREACEEMLPNHIPIFSRLWINFP